MEEGVGKEGGPTANEGSVESNINVLFGIAFTLKPIRNLLQGLIVSIYDQ